MYIYIYMRKGLNTNRPPSYFTLHPVFLFSDCFLQVGIPLPAQRGASLAGGLAWNGPSRR